MKATIKVKKEFDVRYLVVDAYIRYWEDSIVNEQDDKEIDNKDKTDPPNMPCALYNEEKQEWHWRITIDIDEGRITNWIKGNTAKIHYKVCDDGVYTLMDNNVNNIITVESYVPPCLGIWDESYGDYICIEIDENGCIKNWEFGTSDIDYILDEEEDN